MCSFKVYTRKENTEESTKAFDGERELETFGSGFTLFHRESKTEAFSVAGVAETGPGCEHTLQPNFILVNEYSYLILKQAFANPWTSV